MSVGARRSILLACSVLASLVMLEGLLRLDAHLRDPGGVDLDELLERSEAAEPNPELRARSLRGLVRPSSDPDLVYELKPGLEAIFKGRSLRVNSHGLRGAEVTEAKPVGTLRIAGLGDSVMFGWGVRQEETYLALLEHCLNRSSDATEGPKVEVLNFAVPGYNTWMEVAAFQSRAVRFAPDVVVLHMTDNDLGLPAFMTEAPPEPGWDRLAVVRYARRALGRHRPPPSLLSPPEVRRLRVGEARAVEERYARMVGPQAVRGALEHLAGETERLGSVPVIVLLLEKQNEPGRLFAEEARRQGFRVATLGEAFSRTLEESGAEATAEGWRAAFWLSAKDAHPNPLGHAVIAEVLRQEFAALWGDDRVCGAGPVPPSSRIP